MRFGWLTISRRTAVQFGTALLIILSAQILPLSAEPSKPASPEFVRIGEGLFHSPLLSADKTVACSSCHVPALGFSGDRPQAVGVAGYVGGRRAPALLGLKMLPKLMWDGRASDLSTQAAIPLDSPEMAVNWPAALSGLQADRQVAGLVRAAQLPQLDRATVLGSLAAYVGSLEAGNSRFDRYYYSGDETALSDQEAWGLRLFVRKARCASCHLITGPRAAFTDGGFHATGIGRVDGIYRDRGRAAITDSTADVGAFKTPSLRGVALRPYLMHDGSMTSLKQVVEHYNRGVVEGRPKIDDRLGPLFLNSNEIEAVIAFLSSLNVE